MTEWISVLDRLPETFIEPVLIARNEGKICVFAGYFDGENFIGTGVGGRYIFVNPTHWMPFPPPPIAEKK